MRAAIRCFRPPHGWRRAPEGLPLARAFVYLALAAVGSVALGFALLDARAAGRLVSDWGYAVMAVTVVWWLAAILADFRCGPDERSPARLTGAEWRTVGCWIGGLTLVAVLTTGHGYKVLYDEVVIQSTAWNMHMEREVGALGRAYEVDGMLRSLQSYLDKRPYFFPFLVSLVHDLTGYRELNAMLLNTALHAVVLLQVYLLARRLAGHAAGVVALVSAGAFPLMAINATGAGLEMANLAMILGLALAGARWLERPDDRRLSVLILTAVLLAQTRYESGVFVPVAGALVVMGWIRGGVVRLPAAALLAPVLLIPCALLNTYLSGTPVLWELRDGYEARFSTLFLRQNLAHARDYFFSLSPEMANSVWLTLAGGLAGSLAAWRLARRLGRGDGFGTVEGALGWIGVGVLINLGLIMAYYWGDLSDPVASRLALPLHMLLAILVGWMVMRAPEAWRSRAVGLALGCALLAYQAWGLRVNARLNQLNVVETVQRWEQRVVEARGLGTRMVVTDKSPLFWYAQGMGATSIVRASARAEGFAYHLAHHTFGEILVTQALRASTPEGDFQVETPHRLPPEFVLEPVAERRVGARLQRISVLKEIRMDARPPEALSSEDQP